MSFSFSRQDGRTCCKHRARAEESLRRRRHKGCKVAWRSGEARSGFGRTFSAGGDGPPCTFLDRLGETVLMASKSKRSSRGTTSTIGDVKFETSGPTVELDGPTPTDKGDTNGADRGRTRPSRKTTRRASGKPRTNRSTP